MSKVNLRVLQIEDREQDVVLMTRHLTQAGYDVSTLRVQTAESLKAALGSQEWDVAICDFSMPHLNALGALKITVSVPR
jgi:CheY-like chemotaxis protein